MILKQKIGVVGNGFVGGAVKFGFSPQTGCDAEVRVYDKNPNKSTHGLDETINESDFIFLSVPTPANKDGSINIDILNEALKDIDGVHNGKNNSILVNCNNLIACCNCLVIIKDWFCLIFNCCPNFISISTLD